MLDWPTRFKICVGIAKGLAYLHEESSLKIAHRDIKATNVLLDKDLNPKISDFGLATLIEDEKTHISTRVAGTITAEDTWHQSMHCEVICPTKQVSTALGLSFLKLLAARTTIIMPLPTISFVF